MAIVSFSFNGTLSEEQQQQKAAELLENGHEVWIIENRKMDDDNTDIFEVAEKLGIPRTRIQLIGEKEKPKFMSAFDIHFDSNPDAIDLINKEKSNCVALLVCDATKPIE